MAKMLDLMEHNGRYTFRWRPEGQDFNDTLTKFKSMFPPSERTYYPEQNHLWGVPATPEAEATLAEIFSNASNCITQLHSQMRLL